jgi:hypothetical protein
MTFRTITKAAASTAAISVAAFLTIYVVPAPSQPPAGASGRAGGGSNRAHATKQDFNDHEGFASLFDGATLKGWDGDMKLWSVKDGSIYINPTCEHPTGTVYIVWQGGDVSDFDLRLEMKGTGAVNSGVQYRSWLTYDPNAKAPSPPAGGGGRAPSGLCPSGQPRGAPPDRASQAKWDMGGYQYDFDNNNAYPGQLYEQLTPRGIITYKGEIVETREGKPKQLLAALGDKATVDSWYNKDDWNTEEIIAIGNTLTHLMNGHLMSLTIDNEKSRARASGRIGIEVESTGEVFVRNIWLKKY